MMVLQTRTVTLFLYISLINCLLRTEQLSLNLREKIGGGIKDNSLHRKGKLTQRLLKCGCNHLIPKLTDLRKELNRTRVVFKVMTLPTNERNTDRMGHVKDNSVHVIATCLAGANQTDRQNCNDTSTASLPVIGSDGNFYKNAFCAKCNSIKPCARLTNNSRLCRMVIFLNLCPERKLDVGNCSHLKIQINSLLKHYMKNQTNPFQHACNESLHKNLKYLSKCMSQGNDRRKWKNKSQIAIANNITFINKTSSRNYTEMKKKSNLERCLLRNSTMFIILNGKTVINSSRLLKMVFSTMNIKEILSNQFSIVYENKERVIIKIKCEGTNEYFSKLQNVSYLLNENETLIFHSLTSPTIQMKNNTYLFINDACAIADPLDFSSVKFTNSCDVFYSERIITKISLWISLTSNDTKRYIYTCKNHHVDIDWPFTVFIAGLICMLFYYFFRTICHKNQGYVRTYYVKSTDIFLTKPNT